MDDLDKSARSRGTPLNGSKGHNSIGAADKTTAGYAGYIRRFDIYTKLHEEYKVQTSGGATLSLLGWVIMTILIFGELQNYLTPSINEHMVVDTTLGQQLRVNLNMSFHALTCNEVHLDAMDVAGDNVKSLLFPVLSSIMELTTDQLYLSNLYVGDNQLNIEHDMLKQRVSELGYLIGTPTSEIIGKVLRRST